MHKFADDAGNRLNRVPERLKVSFPITSKEYIGSMTDSPFIFQPKHYGLPQRHSCLTMLLPVAIFHYRVRVLIGYIGPIQEKKLTASQAKRGFGRLMGIGDQPLFAKGGLPAQDLSPGGC